MLTDPFEPVLAKTVNINISPVPAGITGLINSIILLIKIIESALARPAMAMDSIDNKLGC